MDECTRWTPDNLICYSGGTAWGITLKGQTFAIGPTAGVQDALRNHKAQPELAHRLYAAGIRGVSEEIPNDPQKLAV